MRLWRIAVISHYILNYTVAVAKFKTFSINIHGRLTTISRPWVMGILNVTPDSFYAGSRTPCNDAIATRARQLLDEGADIIDIGGYSSRPGADDVTAAEEYDRLKRGIGIVRQLSADIPISVDTFRADVARRCVECDGADIINDISGGDLDADMFSTVAGLHVPYIVMHMRGTPATMQQQCDYPHGVTTGVIAELGCKIDRLRQSGVCDIIVDPGFGFSKTISQNYELLNDMAEFHILDLPLLIGVSRKSMIYKLLDTCPAESLNGTTVLNTIALLGGVHILRVHDVAQAVEAVKIVSALTKNYEY